MRQRSRNSSRSRRLPPSIREMTGMFRFGRERQAANICLSLVSPMPQMAADKRRMICRPAPARGPIDHCRLFSRARSPVALLRGGGTSGMRDCACPFLEMLQSAAKRPGVLGRGVPVLETATAAVGAGDGGAPQFTTTIRISAKWTVDEYVSTFYSASLLPLFQGVRV